MQLSELERQKLADAAQASAYLEMSSIPEAAQMAAQRRKEQLAERLQGQKLAASQAETEAALGVRSSEGRLNRDAAMARTQELTSAQRDQLAALTGAGNLSTEITGDIENLPEGGDELGGWTGAVQWVLETAGINPVTNYFKDNYVSAPVQELQAKAAGLYTQAVQSMQKGVLSDQDFRRVEALNITDASLNKQQLATRISAIEQIMANAYGALGANQGSPPPQSQPPQNVVNFGDL
jgi:hypothetical protein